MDALPTCCEPANADTDEEKVELIARIHLQAIMKLAGVPLLPYNVSEIKGAGITVHIHN